jgi:transmembrane protein EpsG
MVTYLIYTIVLFLSMYFAYLSGKNIKLILFSYNRNKLDWFYVLSLLFIVTLAGLRSDQVGTDSENYKSFFLTFSDVNENIFSIFNMYFSIDEPGFLFVNFISSKLSGHYTVPFLFLSLITWVFVFKTINTEKQILFLLIYFAFVTGFFSFTINGLRQAVAASIFFYSFQFITKQKFTKYVLYILLAASFHYSALLLIPIYFIIHRITNNPILWFILVIGSSTIINLDISFIKLFLPYIPGGYSTYINILESQAKNYNTVFSVGFLFQLLIGLFSIYYFSRLNHLYPKYNNIFKASFIYTIMILLFYSNPVLLRFAAYFHLFQIYVLSIITKGFIQRNNQLAFSLLFLTFTALFYYRLYINESNMNPYLFWFQT